MGHIGIMLGCILDKAGSDEILKYSKTLDVPAEYLAGYNLDGKESEQTVPVDVFLVADEKGLIIQYDVHFGPIIFNEIRDKVNENYNRILEKLQGRTKDKWNDVNSEDKQKTQKEEEISNEDLENKQKKEEISNEDYHTILLTKLDEAINQDLTHYHNDLGIDRRYLVAAVRDGIKGNVLEPIPDVIYSFEKKYQPDEFGTIQIQEEDKTMLNIIQTIIKGGQIIKEKTLYESKADFDAERTGS